MLVTVTDICRRLRNAPQQPSYAVQHDAPNRPKRPSTRVISLVVLSIAYYFTYGPHETVTSYFVRDQLGSGLAVYTLIWSLFGAAALLTLPLATHLSRLRPGVVNAVGAIVWGATMLPLAFADNLLLVAIGFTLSGAIWGPYSAIETTALHRWTDPADHGPSSAPNARCSPSRPHSEPQLAPWRSTT